MSNIYKALEYLPEELITQEIATAVIEEGHISVLDNLPHKYLTGTAVLSIIEKNKESCSWVSFELSSLPDKLRSKEVCEFAVKKSDKNIVDVPTQHLSSVMLDKLLDSVEENLKYLHMFPQSLWSVELALKGVKRIYSYSTSHYGRRGAYRSSSTTYDIKRVMIFMTYVPEHIKNEEFYRGLSDAKIKASDIDVIMPKQYKQGNYYVEIARESFHLVPEENYCYEILFAALQSRQISIAPPDGYKRPNITQTEEHRKYESLFRRIEKVMDDDMANMIVEGNTILFKRLPVKFQTAERLMFAIRKGDSCTRDLFNMETHAHLLTVDVCKAYISNNYCYLPKFPHSIWTPDFVEHCVKYGTSFCWLEQMPKELQTQEMVSKALSRSRYQIQNVRPELISLETAQNLYRENDIAYKDIPKHFLNDFEQETGLSSEKYFGKEVSFAEFREKRDNNTYCRLGECYIAIESELKYSYSNYYHIHTVKMTRRSASSFIPEVVFESDVSTFHSTWLEKMIAEYDPTFVKPTVKKSLKKLYVNSYYSLSMVSEFNDTAIYANILLDEKVYYSALIGEQTEFRPTIDGIKEAISEALSIEDIDDAA